MSAPKLTRSKHRTMKNNERETDTNRNEEREREEISDPGRPNLLRLTQSNPFAKHYLSITLMQQFQDWNRYLTK